MSSDTRATTAGRDEPTPEEDGSPGAVDRAKGLVGRVLRSRVYRANVRMGETRANILSAGIAFYGVFSLFPLLALAVTVFGAVLRRNAALQTQVFDYVDTALPGLLRPQGATEGGIIERSDILSQGLDPTTLGLSALVGVVVLAFTALGWIAALREGIRSVFLKPIIPLDLVRAKLFDLVVVLTLGVLLVASAGVSAVAGAVLGQLRALLGLSESGVAGAFSLVLVFVTSAAVDTLLFIVLYRVLAGAKRPWRGLVSGAVIAALGVGLLRQAVTAGLVSLGGNVSFLSAFLPILVLFVWLNLTSRIMLFGAAYSAVGPTVAAEAEPEVPPRVPLPRPTPPALPVRWTDRAVLGAGVVLGASAVALVQITGGAVRAAGAGVRALGRAVD